MTNTISYIGIHIKAWSNDDPSLNGGWNKAVYDQYTKTLRNLDQ